MAKSRKTKQKEVLQKTLTTFKTFFTAEEFYAKIRTSHISLATIYRFLKELREQKLIYFYQCDGKLLYSHEKKSHCHFVCEQTGKVIHFDVDSLDFLKDKVPGTITSVQLEVRGVCTSCTTDNS